MVSPETPVENLKNIGPKSAEWLREIGIETYADLERTGDVMTFKILKHHRKGITIVMLYALYASLQGRHWNSLTPDEKEMLNQAAAEPLDITLGS